MTYCNDETSPRRLLSFFKWRENCVALCFSVAKVNSHAWLIWVIKVFPFINIESNLGLFLKMMTKIPFFVKITQFTKYRPQSTICVMHYSNKSVIDVYFRSYISFRGSKVHQIMIIRMAGCKRKIEMSNLFFFLPVGLL